MVERTKTGIENFDGLIDGGLPKGKNILICGPPGTGKTIFAMQFACNGAEDGEKCLYYTLGEDPDALIEEAKELGIDLKSDKIQIKKLDVTNSDLGEIEKQIESDAKEFEPERVVIDSMTDIVVGFSRLYNLPLDEKMIAVRKGSTITSGEDVVRNTVRQFFKFLNLIPSTVLLTSERAKGSNYLSRDTISEYVCDGAIILELKISGSAGLERFLTIEKMRMTNQDGHVHRFNIEKGKGIVIEPFQG